MITTQRRSEASASAEATADGLESAWAPTPQARAAASVYRVSPTAATLLLAFVTGSCGVLSQEEQLLTDFFEAARLHDTTAVAKISAVTFNPRVDGVVDRFEVQDVADAGDSKRVTIRASVRQLEGPVTEKTLVFTLARKDARWFITGVVAP